MQNIYNSAEQLSKKANGIISESCNNKQIKILNHFFSLQLEYTYKMNWEIVAKISKLGIIKTFSAVEADA